MKKLSVLSIVMALSLILGGCFDYKNIAKDAAKPGSDEIAEKLGVPNLIDNLYRDDKEDMDEERTNQSEERVPLEGGLATPKPLVATSEVEPTEELTQTVDVNNCGTGYESLEELTQAFQSAIFVTEENEEYQRDLLGKMLCGIFYRYPHTLAGTVYDWTRQEAISGLHHMYETWESWPDFQSAEIRFLDEDIAWFGTQPDATFSFVFCEPDCCYVSSIYGVTIRSCLP